VLAAKLAIWIEDIKVSKCASIGQIEQFVFYPFHVDRKASPTWYDDIFSRPKPAVNGHFKDEGSLGPGNTAEQIAISGPTWQLEIFFTAIDFTDNVDMNGRRAARRGLPFFYSYMNGDNGENDKHKQDKKPLIISQRWLFVLFVMHKFYPSIQCVKSAQEEA